MNFLRSDTKTIVMLFVIYMIANITFLINFNGIYWDDWVIIGNDYKTIERLFTEAHGYAGYFNIELHNLLLKLNNSVFYYRLLIFIMWFGMGIIVYKTLQKKPFFTKEASFIISLFFLTAPLNSAKVALVNFPANVKLFIFFYAFYLLNYYLTTEKKNLVLKTFILLMFFISFAQNSFLIFYALVLLYIFYITYSQEYTFLKNVYAFVTSKIDFILLPVVFYIIKSIYFVPSGLYSGYNKIKWAEILNINNYYETFQLSFIDPIVTSLSLIHPVSIVLFILLLLFSTFFTRQNNEMEKKDVYVLLIGFLAFFLGSFAYIAVGKIPNLYNWASRLQILLPLGFSLMLYYSIQILSNLLNFKDIIKKFIYFILVLSFVSFHLNEQIKYNIDWMYQQSIIENFRTSETIKDNSTFIVKNELGDKLVDTRKLGFYQLNGMAELAFGNDTRLFVATEKELKKCENLSHYKHYNFSTWKSEKPIYMTLKVHPRSDFNKDFLTSLKYLFKLKYLEIVNKKLFARSVKRLVYIDYKEK
jgi:hypothetical protein